MRVGILTLPLNENYGGILQAYALQTVLEKLGHNVSVYVKKYPQDPSWILKSARAIVQCAKYLIGRRNVRILWWKRQSEIRQMRQYTDKFINTYINTSWIDLLSEINLSDYDAIVVGSDQVWRKKYFEESWHSPISDAFLKFAEKSDLLRLSYAASYGLDNISEYNADDIDEVKRLLQVFNFVSVRESSGVDICISLGVASEHVLDPTLLLDKKEYEVLLNSYDYTPKGDIFNYILDSTQSTDNAIDMICKGKKWSTFRVNMDRTKKEHLNIQMPVEEWLSSFKYSKAVITDSFHACVFSLIFNKPFLVMVNLDRGISRVESLLRMFHQEKRLVLTNKNMEEKLYLLEEKPNASNLIELERKRSINLLLAFLEKKQND